MKTPAGKTRNDQPSAGPIAKPSGRLHQRQLEWRNGDIGRKIEPLTARSSQPASSSQTVIHHWHPPLGSHRPMELSSLDLEAGLRTVLPEWGMPTDAPLQFLSVSENVTYLVDDPGSSDPIVFRIHRPLYHEQEEILSELAWIVSLRKAGIIDTPPSLPRRDGKYLATFIAGDIQRTVTAFGYMEGKEPEPADALPQWFTRLGTLTARLHKHSRAWPRPEWFVRKIWDFDAIIGRQALWGDWRQAAGLDPEGTKILERIENLLRDQMRLYGAGEDRFGLIHCDMRLANLLVKDQRLGIIDFDDCGFGWFFYDFAASVSFIEHEPFLDSLMAAWVEGYVREGRLSPEDEKILPVLVMLRRMQLTAWIASRPEASAAQALANSYADGTVMLAEKHLHRYG